MFSDAFNQKNKIEVLDKILYIAEDVLFHKHNELEDEMIFIRTVITRLLKNQKTNLNIALES